MKDTIKLPLDADGVPIRPGDVVYHLLEEGEPQPRRVVAIRPKGPFDNSWRWTIKTCKDGCNPIDHKAFFLTHNKPDSLDRKTGGSPELRAQPYGATQEDGGAMSWIERVLAALVFVIFLGFAVYVWATVIAMIGGML